jgi:hypothetical protein
MTFARKDTGTAKGFVCFVLFDKQLAWVENCQCATQGVVKLKDETQQYSVFCDPQPRTNRFAR